VPQQQPQHRAHEPLRWPPILIINLRVESRHFLEGFVTSLDLFAVLRAAWFLGYDARMHCIPVKCFGF
jgi:hypothetical protein